MRSVMSCEGNVKIDPRLSKLLGTQPVNLF